MSEELLPCPFCGCHGLSAAYPRIIRDQACGVVECHTDNCYAMVVADTLPQAIRAWNRRPALIDHLEADGRVLVPRIPSPEMIAAAWEVVTKAKNLKRIWSVGAGPGMVEVYTAMLSALPVLGMGSDSPADARAQLREYRLNSTRKDDA